MRIRSIKPSVHKDEELWDLEQSTGLPVFRTFTGLWSAADREGRFEWRPRALKTDILPYWDGDFSRVLDALTTRGFIVRYASQGREYGLVRTFTKHQIVNNREGASVLPPPPDSAVESTTPTREARVTHAMSGVLFPALGEQEQEQEGNGSAETRDESRVSSRVEPWTRIWQIYHPMVGHTSKQQFAAPQSKALEDIAKAVAEEVGFNHGEEFDAFATRLLKEWTTDEWVIKKKPLLRVLVSQLDSFMQRARPQAVQPHSWSGMKTYEEQRAEEKRLNPEGYFGAMA